MARLYFPHFANTCGDVVENFDYGGSVSWSILNTLPISNNFHFDIWTVMFHSNHFVHNQDLYFEGVDRHIKTKHIYLRIRMNVKEKGATKGACCSPYLLNQSQQL